MWCNQRRLEAAIFLILSLRRTKNKEGGRCIIPLLPAVRACLTNKHVSKKLIVDFYDRHIELKEMVARDEDSARYEAACEPTVLNHFEGEFGLRQSLMAAGIMDKGGLILEKRTKVCSTIVWFKLFWY